MFEPSEAISCSCVTHMYQLHGDETLKKEIIDLCQWHIAGGKSLYDAQDKIKLYLCEKYGVTWYEKSAEAIQFIIENEYANKEREETSMRYYSKHVGIFF